MVSLLSVTGLLLTAACEMPDAAQEVIAGLDAVRPSALESHVSFLSSDDLLGRAFSSAGEQIAADYIGSRFSLSGLEPLTEDGFFQTVPLVRGRLNESSWRLSLGCNGEVFEIPSDDSTPGLWDAIDLNGVPVVKISGDSLDPASLRGLDLEGTAVLTLRSFKAMDRRLELHRLLRGEVPTSERERLENELRTVEAKVEEENDLRLEFLAAIKGHGALVHLDASRRDSRTSGVWGFSNQVWDPTLVWVDALGRMPNWEPEIRSVRIYREPMLTLYASLPDGETGCTVDIHLDAPIGEPVESRNVVGVIPGSDPDFSDQFVIATAHYDGQGFWSGIDGDSILNSANDNATGTAGLIEIARVLAELPKTPRRSVLFIALSGEEQGLLGSEYFISHPMVPLENIVGVVNLEMLGRTDDSAEGSQLRRMSLTGFEYSTMHQALEEAGVAMGVDVLKYGDSNEYFRRSDNAPFANVGIPAHTLSATLSFSDYHGPDDEWERVDFENMTHLTRAAGLGIWLLANQTDRPTWEAANPELDRYVEAWRQMHGEGE